MKDVTKDVMKNPTSSIHTGRFNGQNPYQLLKGPHWIRATCEIAGSHPHFDGHFDDFSLLPGASQVGMVADLISHQIQRRIHVKGIKRGKFASKLVPGTTVTITIDPMEEGAIASAGASAKWEIRDATCLYSTGQLLYE